MTAWALLGGMALVIANAFFVAAEFALIAARRTRIEGLAAEGNRRARVALAAMSDLNFVLAGAQLGITMASLGLGFVAEPAIADLLHEPLDGLPEAVASTIEVVVALGVVVAAHMVVGEMVPKNLAIAEPERSALWIAPPFRAYTFVFGFLIWFLNVLANAILRVFRVEPPNELIAAHGPDEIAGMLEVSREQGMIEAFQHGLLARTLEFSSLDARAVMIPRPDVVAVSARATPAEVERLSVETGHSRFPVYRESLDDVIGFVHVKDVLRLPAGTPDQPVPDQIVRRMLVVPESRPLPALLTDMRSRRTHLAVVVDEHGGVAGVVTLEDVLEELIGDIRDEHDRGEGALWRLGPRRSLIDAGLRPDELERLLGLDVPEGEYDTVAGFLLAELGRVPEVGDEVEVDGWRLRIRRMDERRVDLVEAVEPPGPVEAVDPVEGDAE